MIPTYDLMKRLIEENPEAELYFVAGSDLFPTLHLWENGERLKQEINFLIFKREGFPELEAEDYPDNYCLIENDQIKEMSSSEV